METLQDRDVGAQLVGEDRVETVAEKPMRPSRQKSSSSCVKSALIGLRSAGQNGRPDPVGAAASARSGLGSRLLAHRCDEVVDLST